jgi:hypothetical protein
VPSVSAGRCGGRGGNADGASQPVLPAVPEDATAAQAAPPAPEPAASSGQGRGKPRSASAAPSKSGKSGGGVAKAPRATKAKALKPDDAAPEAQAGGSSPAVADAAVPSLEALTSPPPSRRGSRAAGAPGSAEAVSPLAGSPALAAVARYEEHHHQAEMQHAVPSQEAPPAKAKPRGSRGSAGGDAPRAAAKRPRGADSAGGGAAGSEGGRASQRSRRA